jgi:hypothetical protein
MNQVRVNLPWLSLIDNVFSHLLVNLGILNDRKKLSYLIAD